MIKPFALVIAAGLLAGCGSAPKAPVDDAPGAAPHKGCYQADWQAETMPVISKRIGPDGLEKYDSPPKGKEQGCP
ncbi:hypothetical protein JFT60_18915 [Pseudomonas sp. MF6772]|uniref:hypothetical protein n=1 Tax=Pseudomonas TaxID=286 RepID=UPI0014765289|nr:MULTISPECIES: hypothetical protein [Pseudomonas]MBJ2269457.1 hypothetical protein [Pseudomonas sp. MF6772]MBL7230851.1 hypothetical protein [Pseudomonas sp.]MCU0211872.1 hypothetical protein [Pseudomonas shahriarae]MDD1132149.1 hypothetical protein [Pseudomonas shahriarae]NMY20256.1 hypothetical protein [Pseudomonas sp. WS 5410]